jgi:hypothetical protein
VYKWASIHILIPPESIHDGDTFHQIWNYLKSLGFIENDWCHLERPDGAVVELAPSPPPPQEAYIDYENCRHE